MKKLTQIQIDHISLIADLIEENGKSNPEFNMNDWVELSDDAQMRYEDDSSLKAKVDAIKHPCDTTACIAGYSQYAHCLTLKTVAGDHLKAARKMITSWCGAEKAAARMGIPWHAADYLFCSTHISNKWAIRILRGMAKAGEVPEDGLEMSHLVYSCGKD